MIAAPFMSRAILYATIAAALLGAFGMHNSHAIGSLTVGAQATPVTQTLHANT